MGSASYLCLMTGTSGDRISPGSSGARYRHTIIALHNVLLVRRVPDHHKPDNNPEVQVPVATAKGMTTSSVQIRAFCDCCVHI